MIPLLAAALQLSGPLSAADDPNLTHIYAVATKVRTITIGCGVMVWWSEVDFTQGGVTDTYYFPCAELSGAPEEGAHCKVHYHVGPFELGAPPPKRREGATDPSAEHKVIDAMTCDPPLKQGS